nr:unnamed protein product [Brassica rapa]
MVLVTVECDTINEAIEDYGSCVNRCFNNCGTDEHCQYHCRWICPKHHTPQFILKDEAILPQEGRTTICFRNCTLKCGADMHCMHNCLKNCPH